MGFWMTTAFRENNLVSIILIFIVQKSADLYSRRNYTSYMMYVKQVWMAIWRMKPTDINTAYLCLSILSLNFICWEKTDLYVEDKL